MFIAHLPSGIIYAYCLSRNRKAEHLTKPLIYATCILGAIAPDLDMFYFYFIDNKQTLHHQYWSHLPVVWLSFFGVACLTTTLLPHYKTAVYAAHFAAGGVLHLLLDTIAGDIWWLFPLSNSPISLFQVPSLYNPWWLNFIFHWSFALEVIITVVAIALAKREYKGA